MPFAEFQPGTAGLALPQFQLQSQEQALSLMQRAQAMRVQQEQLEMEKQNLASTLAVNAQQVAASRAGVAKMKVEAEGATTDNIIKKATSDFTLGVIKQASQAFGTDPQTDPATGTPVSNFQQDVSRLYSMPTETPKQLAEYKAHLGYVNSRYAPLAEVHPAAKLMFDQALAPVKAKIEGAVGLQAAQSLDSVRELSTALPLVSTRAELDTFLDNAGAKHDFAMRDTEYKKQYEAVAKDVRDNERAFQKEKELAMAQAKAEAEKTQQLRDRANAVDLDGFSGVAPSSEGATAVRSALAIYTPTKGAIASLRDIMQDAEKNPMKAGYAAARSRAWSLQQDLTALIGRLQAVGVLTTGERESMMAQVPNPATVLSEAGRTKAALDQIERIVDSRMVALGKANNIARTMAAATSQPLNAAEVSRRMRAEDTR